MVKCHAHSIHEGQVQAAHFAVVVAGFEVVDDATSLERATAFAGQQDRLLPWLNAALAMSASF